MATIKAYTDEQQSKKLAEFLPIESADMEYLSIKENGALIGAVPFVKDDSEVEDSAYSHIYDRISCWSLAALLSVIPQELFDGEYIINITEGRNHKWIISYEPYSGVSSYIDVSSDSLIDCCVEMIIKLKKRNLL